MKGESRVFKPIVIHHRGEVIGNTIWPMFLICHQTHGLEHQMMKLQRKFHEVVLLIKVTSSYTESVKMNTKSRFFVFLKDEVFMIRKMKMIYLKCFSYRFAGFSWSLFKKSSIYIMKCMSCVDHLNE